MDVSGKLTLKDKLARREGDLSSAGTPTIVALGDSVTQGCFELRRGEGDGYEAVTDYEAVYHVRLRKMLQYVFPNAPITMINAGVGGQSAPMGLRRLERDVLSRGPDLVIVCFGLNDACGGMENLETYIGAMREILETLRRRDIEAVLLTPNMLNTYLSPLTVPESATATARRTAQIQNEGVMDAFMEAAVALAKGMGIPVCDCYARWKALQAAGVDTTRLLANHINHPTREMHELFAAALFEILMGMGG